MQWQDTMKLQVIDEITSYRWNCKSPMKLQVTDEIQYYDPLRMEKVCSLHQRLKILLQMSLMLLNEMNVIRVFLKRLLYVQSVFSLSYRWNSKLLMKLQIIDEITSYRWNYKLPMKLQVTDEIDEITNYGWNNKLPLEIISYWWNTYEITSYQWNYKLLMILQVTDEITNY